MAAPASNSSAHASCMPCDPATTARKVRENQNSSAIDTVAVLTQPEVDQVLPVVRFRAECLNAHWFLTLADAREKLEACCKYYNEERPHGAIGNK